MRDISADLVALGLAGGRIHTETFGPESSLTPGIAPATARSPHPPPGPAGAGPQVAFARAGLTVPWDNTFDSLLELAEACDVPTRWSCRTGVCHTCETRLISGAIDYQPDPVEPPADGNLLICCSRPTAEFILDL
jgi:ferredoxin